MTLRYAKKCEGCGERLEFSSNVKRISKLTAGVVCPYCGKIQLWEI